MWISSWAGKQFITSNTSSKPSAQTVVSSRNWRNMNKSCSEVKRKKWAKWWTVPLPPPPLPPYPTSLVSEEKWSLCSLLSLKGDIWRMGGWTDPSDENLRGPLPAGAVHCPRLPWKPLYMLNLLLFSQIWPRSDWHGRAAERKRVLPALAWPLSGCSCCNVAKKTSPKIKSFFFFFSWCKVVFAKLRVCCVLG